MVNIYDIFYNVQMALFGLWNNAKEFCRQYENKFIKRFERSLHLPYLYASSKIPFDQPLDQVWIRLVKKDFGATIHLWQVGACFKALDELVFMVPSKFFGIFLPPKQSHLSIAISLTICSMDTRGLHQPKKLGLS